MGLFLSVQFPRFEIITLRFPVRGSSGRIELDPSCRTDHSTIWIRSHCKTPEAWRDPPLRPSWRICQYAKLRVSSCADSPWTRPPCLESLHKGILIIDRSIIDYSLRTLLAYNGSYGLCKHAHKGICRLCVIAIEVCRYARCCHFFTSLSVRWHSTPKEKMLVLSHFRVQKSMLAHKNKFWRYVGEPTYFHDR